MARGETFFTLTLALSHQGRGNSFHALPFWIPAFAGMTLAFRTDPKDSGYWFFAFVFHAEDPLVDMNCLFLASC